MFLSKKCLSNFFLMTPASLRWSGSNAAYAAVRNERRFLLFLHRRYIVVPLIVLLVSCQEGSSTPFTSLGSSSVNTTEDNNPKNIFISSSSATGAAADKHSVPRSHGITAYFTWEQVGSDINGESAEDQSGRSVGMSADGKRVVVGAPKNDGNGSDSGHARVYQEVDGAWLKVGNDINGESEGDESGYSVGISADGKRIVVGAIWNDGNGDKSGHARVYQEVGGAWLKVGNDIDGGSADDWFGWSVGMSADGKRIIVGAPKNDGNGENSGHARVYQEVNGSWLKVGSDVEGVSKGDETGHSVGMSADGKRIIVGAPYNDGNGSDSGHARVYQEVNGAWLKVGNDIDGESKDDWLGYSVGMSADGKRIIVGAPYNDGHGNNSGHARVYQEVDGAWLKVGSDINGESEGDESGNSVGMSADGKRIIVGATFNDGNGDYSGHARVYREVDGAWWKVGSDIDGESAEEFSGHSVGMSADGERLIVGAPYNDGNGENSGHARVFTSAIRTATLSPSIQAPTPPNTNTSSIMLLTIIFASIVFVAIAVIVYYRRHGQNLKKNDTTPAVPAYPIITEAVIEDM